MFIKGALTILSFVLLSLAITRAYGYNLSLPKLTEEPKFENFVHVNVCGSREFVSRAIRSTPNLEKYYNVETLIKDISLNPSQKNFQNSFHYEKFTATSTQHAVKWSRDEDGKITFKVFGFEAKLDLPKVHDEIQMEKRKRFLGIRMGLRRWKEYPERNYFPEELHQIRKHITLHTEKWQNFFNDILK